MVLAVFQVWNFRTLASRPFGKAIVSMKAMGLSVLRTGYGDRQAGVAGLSVSVRNGG